MSDVNHYIMGSTSHRLWSGFYSEHMVQERIDDINALSTAVVC